MSDAALRVVDGLKLDGDHRALLQPGETVIDSSGRRHALPRFFYQIESWDEAKRTLLSTHFRLSEILSVDCRETPLLLEKFPHFVPCAVSVLARYLEAFRQRVEVPVFISVNGGYRSPAHQLSRAGSLHSWACAVDVYRIGDTFLDDQGSLEKYARIAESIAPEVRAKPFGHGQNETDDHLHLDIGYVNYIPREMDEAT